MCRLLRYAVLSDLLHSCFLEVVTASQSKFYDSCTPVAHEPMTISVWAERFLLKTNFNIVLHHQTPPEHLHSAFFDAMTIKKWPSSCSYAVSSIHTYRHAGAQFRRAGFAYNIYIRTHSSSSNGRTAQQNEDLKKPEKAALVEIEGLRKIDPVNPPRSTVPPPLNLPTKGDDNIALYYFRVGRAYGSFYWVGIKAVWNNHKASKALQQRIAKDAGAATFKSVSATKRLQLLNRSEFQLLARNSHDIGKLPLFGLLVCLFGEWLPLLVPFIPGAVPGTCRIPKQIRGMRAKAEERRRVSFRRGTSEPSKAQMPNPQEDTPSGLARTEWPMIQKEYAAWVLQKLRDDQLYHLSSSLNLHNRMWDRVQLPPPSFLLRRGISKHLAYLASDDKLLLRADGVRSLEADELKIACEERGLDVLGKREETLSHDLSWWLNRQKEDEGKGFVMFTMLFRRLAIREWVLLNLKANESLQTQRMEDKSIN